MLLRALRETEARTPPSADVAHFGLFNGRCGARPREGQWKGQELPWARL